MKKKIIFLLALWLCFLAWAASGTAENRALLVGVGLYQRADANLPGIDRDIASMKEAAGLLGFKPNQIKVLMDEQATQANVTQAIKEWLIAGVTPNDRALFYFSGHGSYIWDKKSNSPDGISQVLMMHDSGIQGATLTGVLVDHDFGALLDQLRAKLIVVLVDACHSGTIIRQQAIAGRPKVYPRFYQYPGMPRVKTRGGFTDHAKKIPPANTVSLSAAQDDEQAIGDDDGGFFTRGMTAALRKAAKEHKPLTIEELRAQSAQFISAKTPSGEKVHHPFVFGQPALANVDLFKMDTLPLDDSDRGKKPDLWKELETLVEKAAYKVEVSVNKTNFKIGDPLIITCQASKSGYLNVLSISPGEAKAAVLFPNKYHQNNFVDASTVVTIPSPGDAFALRTQPPLGQSLLVVIHTPHKINAATDGDGSSADLFKTLSQRTLRGLTIEPPDSTSSFGAGKVVTITE